MAKRKANKTAKAAPQQSEPLDMANAPFFPFARYTSIVGVHTSLLAFVALFFPRMFIDADMEQSSSKDRPQHPFLVALTTSPTITVSSMILGVVVLQAWWGGWIRDWLIDYSLNGSDDARRLDKTKINERKTSVSDTHGVESRY